ncbi:hypothetical protein EMIT0373P_30124 [Pseudomonas chlororaphis]
MKCSTALCNHSRIMLSGLIDRDFLLLKLTL